MQKIKNMLHHNTDANHNGIPDSQERTGATTTTGRDPILHDHGTNIHNPAVAPMTGSTAPVVVGQHGVVGGLNDRNHNGIPDSQERGATGGPIQKVKDALHLNKDANHNGIPDSQERDRNHNGIPDSQERGAHHNPLDRNHDGKVNLQDLKSNKDRNHNGIPDNQERSGLVGGLNDRNHNGIPDNLERGTMGLTREAPVQVQVVEKNVVVHEHIHPVEKEEIQPVIYREREQMEVKQITQQLHETQIQPTLVQQRELAAEVRAPIIERGAPIQENTVFATTDRDVTMRSVQVNAPIVNETIKRTVIEEVQPVLERDVFVPTIVQQTQPIYEKVVEAPHVYRETLPVRELGTRNADYVQPIQPVMREVAPIAPVPAMVQPITVQTTTTTTDSFIPAKLINDTTHGTHGTTTHGTAPAGRKLL